MALDLGTTMKKKKKGSTPSGADAAGGDAFSYTEFAPLEEQAPAPAPARARKPAPPTQQIDRPRAKGAVGASIAERLLSFKLPFLGDKPIGTQVQVLLIAMGASAVVFVSVLLLDQRTASNGAAQIEILTDTLMHTQRLAKAAPYAVEGVPAAFAELMDSRDRIASNLSALESGDPRVAPSSARIQPDLARLIDRWKASESAASIIIAQQKALTSFGNVIKRINETSPRLLQLTEEISALKLQQGASPREIAATGQLVMLTQRLGKSANSMVAGEAANAEVALTLGRDIALFRDLTQALLTGSEALRIPATNDGETRARLQELAKLYAEFQNSIGGALAGLQSIVQAKDAEQSILRDSETLREMIAGRATEGGMSTGGLRSLYIAEQRDRVVNFWVMSLFGLAVLLSAFAISKVLLDDTKKKANEAESQRAEAVKLEEDAKRTNEQNQAAILRLMNELQEVADGNLTVQATVTEDITGAIADSVNYTVEELRGLVGRINVTAEQVNTASTAARDIATRLLTASEAQSREIRDTGEKVLQMANQINDVSRSAGESAKVARTSLEAAERGQRAVYNQIAGMNEIREQIQETAKRIKRLGESSQEIGEIVELITDITEQTNVLALNAAIQAASAGDAGRGFSVVAEEVQRLADRSAEAAKQIGALVRTIQTDTQDAVAAMERSTQGVVEGTKLSDAAGTALADIGRVSRQLAELIERIAGNTNEQAQSAGGVAQSIERILSVTEQTSQGTRQAAQSIGQLATLARELKASVARFRVA
jgi:twitching motility protein PilJ